ncbi:MAG: response regulator [Candidatus Korobacteraceae bacterium]|jgi:CheY-like chemotaxis protein
MTDAKPYRILVVDDEADVRDYLRTALEDAGFVVETAKDGLEAMESVQRSTPDLVSLDLVMPRHSGARFFHDLQKDKILSKIPVLIVTGHARDEMGKADFNQMTMSGPGIYLEKPVRHDSYVSAVRSLLGVEAADNRIDDSERLRGELASVLSTANTNTLQRALDALKKR